VPTLSPGTGLSEAGGHGGPLYESTELLSRSDWTPAARGGARVKLHKIRCRSKKYLTAEIAEYAEIIYFFLCDLRGEILCFFFDRTGRSRPGGARV